MKVSNCVLKALQFLVSAVVAVFLLLAGMYSVYALWDNAQVYAAADNVHEGLLQLKPEPEAEDNGPTFAELRAINPDVCAWLTLTNTRIDYPVLQGENNLTYINTDVYGDFALAGSIFLDSGCDRTFQGAYSLLYGHHMENGRMFGDLDLYKNEEFFDENTTGSLILQERTYDLEIFACLLVPSSEDAIFDTQQWRADIDGLLDFVSSNAMYVRQDMVDDMRASDKGTQLLAMSTCASEYTDARTIIMAVMKPHSPDIKQEGNP